MTRFTLFSSCCGLLLIALTASASATALPGPLVSAQWLHDHLNAVTVVDVREDPASFTSKPQYAAAESKPALQEVGGHVPGALLIEFGKIRTTRKIDGREIKAMLPQRKDFEAIMRAAGVSNGKPIVIASAGDGVGALDMAARLYWSLKYYGAPQIAILNGGTAGWLQSGYPVSTNAAAVKPGNWHPGKIDSPLLAGSNDVLKAMSDHAQLIDARSMPQYLGISKKPAVLKAGHIEGAHSFPTDAIVRNSGIAYYFMSAPEYRSITTQLGIKDRSPSITYCNTGHLASGAWFVMSEVLDNPSVRLYDGSMLEWTIEKHPVVSANAS